MLSKNLGAGSSSINSKAVKAHFPGLIRRPLRGGRLILPLLTEQQRKTIRGGCSLTGVSLMPRQRWKRSPVNRCWTDYLSCTVIIVVSSQAPPWPEIYEMDTERRHGFETGVLEYLRLEQALPALGYAVISLPKVRVSDRADFVLAALST